MSSAPLIRDIDVEPQAGPQALFLSHPADLIIYGGAAGGGKSYGMLLDPLMHRLPKDHPDYDKDKACIDIAGYNAVIFRRTYPQITNQGALWDDSFSLYPHFGAKANHTNLKWTFPSGAVIRFAAMQYGADRYQWQGAQITNISFDELTHFEEDQFWYLLSRNRSICGVKPYVRAATNPDADSWVADLIAWWIDQETGYPIPERAGKIRWFARIDDQLYFANTRAGLLALDDRIPEEAPKTMTFIPAKLEDNPALLRLDPGYLANLMAQPRIERERLLGGNWKIRATAGEIFKRIWFTLIENLPPRRIESVRFWDLAATLPEAGKDPDYLAGVLMHRYDEAAPWGYVIGDLKRDRLSPAGVTKLIVQTAMLDGRHIPIRVEQEGGAGAKMNIDYLTRQLPGWDIRGEVASGKGSKLTRAGPLSRQAEIGNVAVLAREWTDALLNELEGFPEGAHDDIVDACSGAFWYLTDPSRKRQLAKVTVSSYA